MAMACASLFDTHPIVALVECAASSTARSRGARRRDRSM